MRYSCFLPVVFAIALTGCDVPAPADPPPQPGDLDQPAVLERVLKEAKLLSDLKLHKPHDLWGLDGATRAYNGWVKILHPNGEVKLLFRIKGGKPQGPAAGWREDGTKRFRGWLSNGTQKGRYERWDANGVKEMIQVNFMTEHNDVEKLYEELEKSFEIEGKKHGEGKEEVSIRFQDRGTV